MSYRLSKIYTRKGDDGTTSLDAKLRISKDDPQVEAIGDIDELNSAIGMVLAFTIKTETIKTTLFQVQQELFNLCGELCVPQFLKITSEKVAALENKIDEWNKTLPPLKEFILPGGTPASAHCHLARTICRRAERRLVTLFQQTSFNPEILRYINRLSDLLFVAARILAREESSSEVLWEHQR